MPARARANLRIETEAQTADRVVENGRAVGMRYRQGGERKALGAARLALYERRQREDADRITALFCGFDAKGRCAGIGLVDQYAGIFASGITPIVATAPLKSGAASRGRSAPMCCSRAWSRRCRPHGSAQRPARARGAGGDAPKRRSSR